MVLCSCCTVKVRAHELRTKTKTDLLKQLDALKTELSQVCIASSAEYVEMFM